MAEATCAVQTTVEDASLKDELWNIYRAAFGGAETGCIQDQLCYSETTFKAALDDPGYRKIVAMTDGTPVGFILCTNDLERARVAYANPKRFEVLYPTEYSEGRICYYTAIAVRPDKQGRRAATALVQTAGEIMDRERNLIAFDFSTEKNPGLPDLVANGLREGQKKFGWDTNRATFTALGGQTYGVIKLTKE